MPVCISLFITLLRLHHFMLLLICTGMLHQVAPGGFIKREHWHLQMARQMNSQENIRGNSFQIQTHCDLLFLLNGWTKPIIIFGKIILFVAGCASSRKWVKRRRHVFVNTTDLGMAPVKYLVQQLSALNAQQQTMFDVYVSKSNKWMGEKKWNTMVYTLQT